MIAIKCPDYCYGFVICGAIETQNKETHLQSNENRVFISIVEGDKRAISLPIDMQELNPGVNINIGKTGWINDQFVNNRVTVEFFVYEMEG